jgi:polyisoprenoid-binding protein YceI
MKPFRPSLFVIAILALAGAAFAGEYKIDPAHTTAAFAVKHLGISTVPGHFGDVSGAINYDEKDPSKSSVKVSIKTASIDTNNGTRDKDLRSPNFFDVAKYPEITFESNQVKKNGDDWVAVGTFTMHGVSKTIELPFTLNGPVQDPWGKQRLGVESNTKLSRAEYGITADKGLIGDEIKITLSVEAAQPQSK